MLDHAALPLKDPGLLRRRSWIDGVWTDSETDFDVRDPGAMASLARCAAMTPADATRALDAAHAAFPAWAKAPPAERAAPLRRWAALMLEHQEDLARIMVAEQGKPWSEALGEIAYAADFIEFYAEECRRPNVEGVTSHLRDAEVELWREPLGAVALITPWNFPSAMLTRKAAAALAAGCTVVAHPSHETPFSALALAELSERAGLPKGVFNVVAGDAATVTGPWLDDPRARALSFTGSTGVGKMLTARAAGTMKRCIMELGGHAPLMIFADAEFERAVEESVKAKYATSGQDCLAANRIMVERPVYEAFCDAFAKASAALTVGTGMEDCDISPLMNEAAVEKQEAQVADALAKGARLLTGTGKRRPGTLIVEPTVLADVPKDALIWREETFGPVAAIAPFDEEEEALREANDSEYGLIAYVHTMDPRRIYRLSRGLQYGMVAVNRTKVTGAPIPFGGVKQSGLGREGARQGLEAFTEIKYVCRDWS